MLSFNSPMLLLPATGIQSGADAMDSMAALSSPRSSLLALLLRHCIHFGPPADGSLKTVSCIVFNTLSMLQAHAVHAGSEALLSVPR